jgi:uncharacterized protein YbjQ (UPF0145 family)
VAAFFEGRDPIATIKSAVNAEVESRLQSLEEIYGGWWKEHSTEIRQTANTLSDALTKSAIDLGGNADPD